MEYPIVIRITPLKGEVRFLNNSSGNSLQS